MEYKLAYSHSFVAQLKRLDFLIRDRVLLKLGDLIKSGQPMNFAIKLTGSKNRYRFRIGQYRVVFEKEKNGNLVLLICLKVGHRSNIYD